MRHVFCVAMALFAVCGGMAAANVVPAATEAWFREASRALTAKCRRAMDDGTQVYAPDAMGHYKAVWLRDFVYMLEADAVPSADVVPAARVFLDAVTPAGDGVDCVKFDGSPVFKPCYGKWGDKPGADNAPFTVLCGYWAWRRSGDDSFISTQALGRLTSCLKTLPHDSVTGLVWIDPAKECERTGYGFTDSVRKGGGCLFETLLEIEASGRLAEMLSAGQQPDAARAFLHHRATLAEAVNRFCWDDREGMYLAAMVRCRQPDVWGTAYAVWLGVAPSDRATGISRLFLRRLDDFTSHGQVRHLPKGVYWEIACVRDTYQNGGYWGTASGWYAWTLARTSPGDAVRFLEALRADYAAAGVCEWHCGTRRAIASGYPASVCLPYAAIRRLNATEHQPVNEEP